MEGCLPSVSTCSTANFLYSLSVLCNIPVFEYKYHVERTLSILNSGRYMKLDLRSVSLHVFCIEASVQYVLSV